MEHVSDKTVRIILLIMCAVETIVYFASKGNVISTIVGGIITFFILTAYIQQQKGDEPKWNSMDIFAGIMNAFLCSFAPLLVEFVISIFSTL